MDLSLDSLIIPNAAAITDETCRKAAPNYLITACIYKMRRIDLFFIFYLYNLLFLYVFAYLNMKKYENYLLHQMIKNSY